MIIIKLQGGLGNQMFQYAIARALVKEDQRVIVDLSFLRRNRSNTDTFTARNFELDLFSQLKVVIYPNILPKLHQDNLLSAVCRKILGVRVVKQLEHELVKLPVSYKSLYLDGYFQSEYYFKSIKKVLQSDFEFPLLNDHNVNIQQRIQASQQSVSLHIRRGDYTTLANVGQYHGVLPISYYTRAFDQLRSFIGNHTDVFVFTDDPQWAKANLKIEDVEMIFVEGNGGSNSWKDMFLMSLCKHHIIANSSFSWWGAWLARDNGMTFAPKKWFNPEYVKFNI